jgi:hypothetical protein
MFSKITIYCSIFSKDIIHQQLTRTSTLKGNSSEKPNIPLDCETYFKAFSRKGNKYYALEVS